MMTNKNVPLLTSVSPNKATLPESNWHIGECKSRNAFGFMILKGDKFWKMVNPIDYALNIKLRLLRLRIKSN